MEKWYLVETADGAEIAFGSPNSKTGLAMTGGKRVHQIACAQYIIRLHEQAEAKLLKPKPKKKSRAHWKREAKRYRELLAEKNRELKELRLGVYKDAVQTYTQCREVRRIYTEWQSPPKGALDTLVYMIEIGVALKLEPKPAPEHRGRDGG